MKKSLWYGMQDLGNELLGRRHGGDGELRPDEFWAVKDVSFELKRGECLGLIGRNGAGKTTLLRMLNGLIKPDAGRIEMRGRVGALIALGAGFNPILTGRENIYVNGSVLGLTKREIDEKIEEIIDFAEIGEFIDMPVQNYSSGMSVRLGFSIASSLKPDILILDEILAVGDAAFRAKCYHIISKMMKSSAIIFVSHNMEQIARISSYCLVLESGYAKFYGISSDGIDIYNSMLNKLNSDDAKGFCKIFPPISFIKIHPIFQKIKQDQDYYLKIIVNSLNEKENSWVRIVFFNLEGGYAADVDMKSNQLKIKTGISTIFLTIPNIRLRSGKYRIGINIFSADSEILAWSYKKIELEVTNQSHVGNSDYQPLGIARLVYDV